MEDIATNKETAKGSVLFDRCTLETKTVETFDDLKKGDSCWCLNTGGEVYEHFLYGDDIRKLRYGYAYLNEDEAVKESKRNRIYRRLKEIANGYVFDPDKENYYLFYDYHWSSVNVSFCKKYFQQGVVYFDCRKAAIKAIDTIGEEVLIKDYFGVAD